MTYFRRNTYIQGLTQHTLLWTNTGEWEVQVRIEDKNKNGEGFFVYLMIEAAESLNCVRLLATPWTAAYKAPPSMGFSRQEYWSGVPLPSPIFSLDRVNILVKSHHLDFWYNSDFPFYFWLAVENPR